MAAIVLSINGKKHNVNVDPKMALLWVIRDYVGLTGTKFGCGISQCGVCTVHLNGNAVRSCMLPASAAVNAQIITIEGLSEDASHPLQRAWIEEQVPQCGYCQSGQIMAAAALLSKNPHPTDDEIGKAMQNMTCRCGTYPRIKKAIQRAANYS